MDSRLDRFTAFKSHGEALISDGDGHFMAAEISEKIATLMGRKAGLPSNCYQKQKNKTKID